MNRKAYLKDPYADITPAPFAGLDYVLSVLAFVLLAVASVPQIATLLAGQ